MKGSLFIVLAKSHDFCYDLVTFNNEGSELLMIGRIRERSLLMSAFASEESEFVAVYGRRRVGKTYLVRETFGTGFTFQHTGVKNGSGVIQLSRFRQSLVEHGHVKKQAS